MVVTVLIKCSSVMCTNMDSIIANVMKSHDRMKEKAQDTSSSAFGSIVKISYQEKNMAMVDGDFKKNMHYTAYPLSKEYVLLQRVLHLHSALQQCPLYPISFTPSASLVYKFVSLPCFKLLLKIALPHKHSSVFNSSQFRNCPPMPLGQKNV